MLVVIKDNLDLTELLLVLKAFEEQVSTDLEKPVH